jgi:DNA-binding NarL/FixJ family response regulator
LIRILLADQHYLLHAGLQHITAQRDDLMLLEAIATADELYQLHQKDISPDLFLFSPNITRASLTNICDQVQSCWPSVKLLAMLAHPTETCFRQLMEQGVAGVILKSDNPDRLLEAIYMIARGERWLSPSLASTLLQSNPPFVGTALTERELTVLQLLALDKTIGEIAQALNIGERTVRCHLERIYSKLTAKSRIGAVVQAIRLGLIPD